MNIIPSFLRCRIEHRPNLLKIVDNIGWLFFDRLFRLGVGLFMGAWLARYLGPEQFGLLSFAGAFVGLFGTFAVLGLQNIVVRDLVVHPENANKTMGTAAVLQFLGGVTVFGLTALAIHILRPEDDLVCLMVLILGSGMIFKGTAFTNYWFEARVQSKYTVWVTNAVFLVMLVVKIVLILLGFPVISFVWVIFAETALMAIAMLIVFMWRGPGLRVLRVGAHRAVVLLRDSWPLILTGVAISIYMKIDQVMLGQMLGDQAVGIYSVAVRISEVWYFIPMAIVASVFPAILDAKKQSDELYRQRLQQLYDLMVGLSFAVAIPMTFLSDNIIVLLFGGAYQQAGAVLAIHIWASIFVFLGVASGKWFLAENRQILSFHRAAIGAALNIALNLILIPKYAVLGAAWATVISYSVSAFFSDVLQAETRDMFCMKANSFNLIRLFRNLIQTTTK